VERHDFAGCEKTLIHAGLGKGTTSVVPPSRDFDSGPAEPALSEVEGDQCSSPADPLDSPKSPEYVSPSPRCRAPKFPMLVWRRATRPSTQSKVPKEIVSRSRIKETNEPCPRRRPQPIQATLHRHPETAQPLCRLSSRGSGAALEDCHPEAAESLWKIVILRQRSRSLASDPHEEPAPSLPRGSLYFLRTPHFSRSVREVG
jgi:hypothetical protein